MSDGETGSEKNVSNFARNEVFGGTSLCAEKVQTVVDVLDHPHTRLCKRRQE